MITTANSYYAIHFAGNDALHHKGDIQYFNEKVVYVGQTPECDFKIPPHPDYADCCYAVIVKEEGERYIIRQEPDADIRVNGVALQWIERLNDGDHITFDATNVRFSVKSGTLPANSYVVNKGQRTVWVAIAAIAVLLLGLFGVIYEQGRSTLDIFAEEIGSVYKISADTVYVLSAQNDTLDIITQSQAEVGTGFVTTDGYFVTARHCVEYWLGYEGYLKDKQGDIEKEVVQRAIDVECGANIRLLVKLSITGSDGSRYYCSSDDFIMNKEHDNIYEYGDFESSYAWRSIVSQYEDSDAELGDVAVMRWPSGSGNIKLAADDEILKTPKDVRLHAFGFPQNSSKNEAKLTSYSDAMYQPPYDEECCFLTKTTFDHGFSGGPVFVATKNNMHRVVVGLVSRTAGERTLIVPVSQIRRLIKGN